MFLRLKVTGSLDEFRFRAPKRPVTHLRQHGIDSRRRNQKGDGCRLSRRLTEARGTRWTPEGIVLVVDTLLYADHAREAKSVK